MQVSHVVTRCYVGNIDLVCRWLHRVSLRSRVQADEADGLVRAADSGRVLLGHDGARYREEHVPLVDGRYTPRAVWRPPPVQELPPQRTSVDRRGPRCRRPRRCRLRLQCPHDSLTHGSPCQLAADAGEPRDTHAQASRLLGRGRSLLLVPHARRCPTAAGSKVGRPRPRQAATIS